MRWTVLGILLLSTSAFAAPPEDVLDAHLAGWAKAMANVTHFDARFTLTRTENVFGQKQVVEGTARVMKPNLADLALTPQGKPEEGERYLSTGTAVYAFSSARKAVNEYPIANPNVGGNLVLDLLGGMPVAVLKKRLDIKLLKEDANYVILEITPRLKQDQMEFERLQVALFGPKAQAPYAVRQLRLTKPNGDREEWDLDPRALCLNPADVTKDAFRFTGAPMGWSFQPAKP